MTLEALAPGELATIVTYLEMHQPPGTAIPESPLSFRRIEQPDPEDYRELFRLVGSRWLWFSRLVMGDDALAAIIQNPRVELFAILDGDRGEFGMVELDFRTEGECELAFIGLVPELAGQRHGRWLLAEALLRAWVPGVERVHVHTCTLDHSAALPAYRRAGFTAYRRAVERFPDPRLLGILPPDCAPQVPLLGTLTVSTSSPAS